MSNKSEYQFLIIGAGISGLTFSKRLFDNSIKALVIEKSKGLGGRMATRRWNDQMFDHGAQHVRDNIKSKYVTDIWTQNHLLSPWQSDSKVCPEGISKLAKKISENIQVRLETRALKINKINSSYQIICENEQTFEAQNVVLSSPLPQSLEILVNSNLNYDSKLQDITYAKAVVFLISHKEEQKLSLPDYQEWESGPMFSISNQNKKFYKPGFAFTFTMSPVWSEVNFSSSDSEQIENFNLSLKKLSFKIPEGCEIQIKKWRYSHPLSKWKMNYYKVENENIYLIGDAFGGPSINGAIISALELNP